MYLHCVCVRAHAHGVSTLWPQVLQPTRLLHPWNFTGKNTGVGCHSLLHGIVLTQASNPGLLRLLRWQVDSLPLAPPGKPICVTHITSKLESCQIYNLESCPIHNLVIVFFPLHSLGMSNHLSQKSLEFKILKAILYHNMDLAFS